MIIGISVNIVEVYIDLPIAKKNRYIEEETAIYRGYRPRTLPLLYRGDECSM
jgi:hypothetical protein